jgi:hypothetical protein
MTSTRTATETPPPDLTADLVVADPTELRKVLQL